MKKPKKKALTKSEAGLFWDYILEGQSRKDFERETGVSPRKVTDYLERLAKLAT